MTTEFEKEKAYGDGFDAGQNEALSHVNSLTQRLAERTTERDYHMRVGDNLAKNIKILRTALENILEARDDNQPAALNMPDLDYAHAIIKIIHREARDALSRT